MDVFGLVDGDIFIYRACCSSEREMLLSPEEDPDIAFSGFSYFCEVQASFEFQLNKVLETLGAVDFTIALSDGENFRKGLLPDYKANRVGKPKPTHFKRLRAWVEENYNTTCVSGLEGDDILGIYSSFPKFKPKYDKFIISIDKDMKTIPGYFFNPDTEEHLFTTEEEADYNHLLQTMTGDTTDNYKGCPGIGAVKAKALFEKSGANWNTVVEAFRKAGLTEEDALVQARVAYILRGWDYNPKSREIKLWLPKEG